MKKKPSLEKVIKSYLSKKEEILTLRHELEIEDERNLQELLAAIILIGEQSSEFTACESGPLEHIFRGPAFKKKINLYQDLIDGNDHTTNQDRS